MKVYYIIPLNYQLTGHLEIFKIKLYYFQERLNPRYNIIPQPILTCSKLTIETIEQM